MILRETQPAEPLAPFVACCWFVETGEEETSLRPDAILPNGTVNLNFSNTRSAAPSMISSV